MLKYNDEDDHHRAEGPLKVTIDKTNQLNKKVKPLIVVFYDHWSPATVFSRNEDFDRGVGSTLLWSATSCISLGSEIVPARNFWLMWLLWSMNTIEFLSNGWFDTHGRY